jgi:FAD dependent oxidoreductase TIGR03364
VFDADVIVVGGGIAGLAHAVAAHRRGLTVILLERNARAVGASVRNFGMVWPIGQPAGELTELALRSRAIWLEMSAKAGFWCSPCGSVHLAYHDDEMAVLEEFNRTRGDTHPTHIADAASTLSRFPAANPRGLRGALFSAAECAVDPRQAVANITDWLRDQPGVSVRFAAAVTHVEAPAAILGDGSRLHAPLILVCTGEDTRTLFPEVYRDRPLRLCKLQMMRTNPQPAAWTLGMHAAAGSTLRHYPSFANCPTLPRVRERYSREHPRFDEVGIHVMASQNQLGELIIGDSHEYGDVFDPDNRADIDRLILDYLRTFLIAPDLEPAARWHGVYLKNMKGDPVLRVTPQPGAWVVNALGGNGMTLSFGLGEESFELIGAGSPALAGPGPR